MMLSSFGGTWHPAKTNSRTNAISLDRRIYLMLIRFRGPSSIEWPCHKVREIDSLPDESPSKQRVLRFRPLITAVPQGHRGSDMKQPIQSAPLA
jgi:hypothetical protein